MNELRKEIDKIKYHIRLLSESIDYDRHPVENLILSMDWNEDQVELAHDIFEEYDKKISSGEEINWHEFEMRLRNDFKIGYHTVKSIILAFYKNDQWTQVCHGYAMSFEPATPVEFHSITRN